MREMLVVLALLALPGTALADAPNIVETADKVVVEYNGSGDGAQNAPAVVTPAPATDADTPPRGYVARKKWMQERMAAQAKAQQAAPPNTPQTPTTYAAPTE